MKVMSIDQVITWMKQNKKRLRLVESYCPYYNPTTLILSIGADQWEKVGSYDDVAVALTCLQEHEKQHVPALVKRHRRKTNVQA